MSQQKRPPKVGQVGSRATIENDKNETLYEEPVETRSLEPLDPALIGYTGPLASVGLSIEVGQSTKFARKKVSVGAWCTLPCRPLPEEIAATYETCADILFEEASRRASEAVMRFFPEMVNNPQADEEG